MTCGGWTPIGWVGYKYDSSFTSFGKVQFKIENKKKLEIKGIDTALTLKFNLAATPEYVDYILKTPQLNDTIQVGVFNSVGWVKDMMTNLSLKEIIQQKKPGSLSHPNFLPESIICVSPFAVAIIMQRIILIR